MIDCEKRYREECRDVEQEEIVLVGGSFDHQVIYIDKATTSYVQMQIINTRDGSNNSETYVLHTMKGTGGFFRIGLFKGLDQDDLLSKLIEYYKKEPEINKPQDD